MSPWRTWNVCSLLYPSALCQRTWFESVQNMSEPKDQSPSMYLTAEKWLMLNYVSNYISTYI